MRLRSECLHVSSKHSILITFIQEAHGTPLQCKSLQDRYQPLTNSSTQLLAQLPWLALDSPIKHNILEKAIGLGEITHVILGRAATATIEFLDVFIAINNVHVHELSKENTNMITQSFSVNITRAQNHPLARSVAYTAGDFNFQAEGEETIRVSARHR